MQPQPNNNRRSLLGGLVVALLFISVWTTLHPARPCLDTDDLYTHLSVARHLTRGEGFLTDIAFPLSFAYPFARQLPQPLIHRQPGYALLLTGPCVLAGNDPEHTLTLVRYLQITLLGAMIWIGVTGFLRRRQLLNVLPWLLVLLVNPLLAFAVDWASMELVCAVLLLGLWQRVLDREIAAPTVVDGLLAGLLTLLRLDLFWLPLLWWGLYHRARLGDRSASSATIKSGVGLQRWLPALLVWLVLVMPWEIRNIHLTGQPFFNLQSQAEHVKDSTLWPGYSVYQQLQPQPLLKTLRDNPIPVIRKTARGIRFYISNLHRYLPQLYCWSAAMALLVYLVSRIRPLNRRLRPHDPRPMSIESNKSPLGPYVVLSLSLGLLILQYSLFDHNLRHLLVLMPLLVLEGASITGELAWPLIQSRLKLRSRTLVLGLLASFALTGIVLLTMPTRLPGWAAAEQQARHQATGRAQRVQAFQLAGPEDPFTGSADVTWFTDKPGIWQPANPQVRQQILDNLSEQP